MRLLRWLVNGLCLLSLLACVGTGWLWWKSYRGGDRFTFRASGERLGLVSRGGRITLTRLPPAPPTDATGLAAMVRSSRDAGLRWRVSADFRRGPTTTADADVLPEVELWRLHLPSGAGAGVYRPLLDALEDPERFATAHVCLAFYAGFGELGLGPRLHFSPVARRDAAAGRVTLDYCGLRAELPPGGAGWASGADPFHPSLGAIEYNIGNFYEGPAAGYDPAQRPALRDFWFHRCALPAGSVSFLLPLAVLSLPQLLGLALRSRRLYVRRRRGRLGLCLGCGYDLTGNTSGRCSECGERIEAVTAERRVTA